MIEINPNSTIANDIIEITHDHTPQSIMVHLKPTQQRQCQQPQLIGRLSGPFISKLKWTNQLQRTVSSNGEETDVLMGYYDVPEPGQYFLEIIVLMCIEFTTDSFFQDKCLEDPDHHRVTGEEASIEVSNINYGMIQDKELIGYWYNTLEKSKHEPLYTRYQPQGCREDDAAVSPRCSQHTDLSRFDPYEFHFTYKDLKLDYLKKLLEDKHDKVCFVGASHAYWLDHKGTDLLKQLGINTVLVDWFPKNQIRFFKEEDLQYLSSGKNCTKVVIGFGQWDLGDWVGRTDDPTTFLDYYTSLSTLMQWIQALKHDKDASGMEIFFRSTQ